MADLGVPELSLSLPSFLDAVTKQRQACRDSPVGPKRRSRIKPLQHLVKLPKTSLLYAQQQQQQQQQQHPPGAAGAPRSRRDTAFAWAKGQPLQRDRRSVATLQRPNNQPAPHASALQQPSTPKVLSQALERNAEILQRRAESPAASAFAGGPQAESLGADGPQDPDGERALIHHATIGFDSAGAEQADLQQPPGSQRGTTVETIWDVLSRPLTAYTAMPSSTATNSRPRTAGDADTLMLHTRSAASASKRPGQSTEVVRDVVSGGAALPGIRFEPDSRPRTPRGSDLKVVLVGKPVLSAECYASEHDYGIDDYAKTAAASRGRVRAISAEQTCDYARGRQRVEAFDGKRRIRTAASGRERRRWSETSRRNSVKHDRHSSVMQLQPYFLTDSESDGEGAERQQAHEAPRNLEVEVDRRDRYSAVSFSTGKTTTSTDGTSTRSTTGLPRTTPFVGHQGNFSSIEDVDSVLSKYAALLSDRQLELARLERPQEIAEAEFQQPVSQSRAGSASVKFAAAVRKAPVDSRPASELGGQSPAEIANSTGLEVAVTQSPKTKRPGSSTPGRTPLPITVVHQDDGVPPPWMPPSALLDDLQRDIPTSRPRTAASAASTGGDGKSVHSTGKASNWLRRIDGVYEYDPEHAEVAAPDGLSPWEHDEGGVEACDPGGIPDYDAKRATRSPASNAVMVDLSESRRNLNVIGAAPEEEAALATGRPYRPRSQSGRRYLDRQRERLRAFEQKRRAEELINTQIRAAYAEDIPHHHRPSHHGVETGKVAAVPGVPEQQLRVAASTDVPQTGSAQRSFDAESPNEDERPTEAGIVMGRKIRRERKLISTESLLIHSPAYVADTVRLPSSSRSETETTAEKIWDVLPLLRNSEENKTTRGAKTGRLRSRSLSRSRRAPSRESKKRPITALRSEIRHLLCPPMDPESPETLPLELEPPTLTVDGLSLAMPPAVLSRPLTGKSRYSPAPARMQFGAGLRIGSPSGVPVPADAELNLFTPLTSTHGQNAATLDPFPRTLPAAESTSEWAGSGSALTTEINNRVTVHGNGAAHIGQSMPGHPSRPLQHQPRKGEYVQADHSVRPSTWISPMPQFAEPQSEGDQTKSGEFTEQPFEGQVRPESIPEDPRRVASIEERNLVGPISNVRAISSEKQADDGESEESLSDDRVINYAGENLFLPDEGESYSSADEEGNEADKPGAAEEVRDNGLEQSPEAVAEGETAASIPLGSPLSSADTSASEFEEEATDEAELHVDVHVEEQQRATAVPALPTESLVKEKPHSAAEEMKSVIGARTDELKRSQIEQKPASETLVFNGLKATHATFAPGLAQSPEAAKAETTKSVGFSGVTEMATSSAANSNRPQGATSELSVSERPPTLSRNRPPSAEQTALEEIADRLRPSHPGSARQRQPKFAEKPSGQLIYDLVFNTERRQKSMSKADIARYPALADKVPRICSAWAVHASPSQPKDRAVERKIEELTWGIKDQKEVNPGMYIERAWLYAENMMFDEAFHDLAVAIANSGAGMAIDARWLRAQIWLLTDNTEMALKDLEAITDSSKTHLGAFHAKAKIYQELDMVKLAIVNYSQVIRLRPDDADGYYARGCLFEQENEAVYADEDFNMVRKLDPSNTHALLKHAMHCFERELWEDSIKAFTSLINAVPEFATAYSFRGRACASLQVWETALEDLTKAIQLAPDRADFFFHRGCLLSERNRKKALEDFGVSLLLDDSPRNARVYFYRALVHTRTKRKDMAMVDFQSVLDREPENAAAHLNLGLLYMEHSRNYPKALQCFNNSIFHDPRNTRAYLCRGELYQRMHESY